jgi:dTDP-4-dehydrorhamnose 3,5-epimerase
MESFVQDNLSFSVRSVLRGLHYQLGKPQGKLITVLEGEIYDVAADIRRGSPHFGHWVGVHLSSKEYRQLFIPPGFAHGFCVTSDTAAVIYKCTDYYSPEDERGIRWDDPELSIAWPVTDPVLSEKDRLNPTLGEIPAEDLPVFDC